MGPSGLVSALLTPIGATLNPEERTNCSLSVSWTRDFPPFRTPQAVHSAIAALIAGKHVVEIGTRYGDGMRCFSQVTASARAIEASRRYCVGLTQSAVAMAQENLGNFSVVCKPYQVATHEMDADVVTWWQETPHLVCRVSVARSRPPVSASTCAMSVACCDVAAHA